jgi:hypothetical protein
VTSLESFVLQGRQLHCTLFMTSFEAAPRPGDRATDGPIALRSREVIATTGG